MKIQNQEKVVRKKRLLSANIAVPTVTSNSELVSLIKIAAPEYVHPVIRKLFTKSIPNVPLAGRLVYFIAAWEKITQGQEILSIAKGYESCL